MCSPTVMDHFNHLRHAGVIEDADGIGEVGNPVCGDMATFFHQSQRTVGCGNPGCLRLSRLMSQEVVMKESYCGLCEQCQLNHPEFLEAVAKVKSFVDQFRIYWWAHCFWGDEGFSLPEFRQGLEWFLSHPECPGCRGGRGLDRCSIRICAINRRCEHCYECPDLAQCDRFNLILQEYPDHKQHLLHLQQQNHGSTLILKRG